jgi:hypothetical protein
MTLGILFIIFGILIIVFPQLLSFIIATFLIFIGIIFIFLWFHFRRASQDSRGYFSKFFFRI